MKKTRRMEENRFFFRIFCDWRHPICYTTEEGGLWKPLEEGIAAIMFDGGDIWDVKLGKWRHRVRRKQDA